MISETKQNIRALSTVHVQKERNFQPTKIFCHREERAPFHRHIRQDCTCFNNADYKSSTRGPPCSTEIHAYKESPPPSHLTFEKGEEKGGGGGRKRRRAETVIKERERGGGRGGLSHSSSNPSLPALCSSPSAIRRERARRIEGNVTLLLHTRRDYRQRRRRTRKRSRTHKEERGSPKILNRRLIREIS